MHGYVGGPGRRRATSLGDLKEPTSKKLLIDLISTLDEFFPDYDFETTKYVARTGLKMHDMPFSQDLFAPFSLTPAALGPSSSSSWR
jgi:hypothetical protein